MSKSRNSIYTVEETVSLKHATGKMRFKFTNDYLFRAILQENKKALKGLICAILGIQSEEIESIEIKNPIELGKTIEAKDFLLDVRILLNNQLTINLEMQVLNLGNWTDRSLAYLCRSFDKLNAGQEYIEARPVIQVCFLDFTLFEEYPEFFSTYMFINVKNHIIYSDKLKLLVIDLTKIDEATEEDKFKGLDHWARLFKATTWEEVKMLAMNNVYLQEAAETAYQLSAEEIVRLQCEAREDFYRQQRYIQFRLEKAEKIEREAERIESKMDQMERKMDQMEREMDQMEREKKQMEREMDQMEREMDQMEREKKQMEREKKQMEREKGQMEMENEIKKQENEKLLKRNENLQKNNEDFQKNNEDLLRSNNEKDSEIARLKAEIQSLRR